MRIGFHASHEQFRPAELLTLLRRAEQSGFSSYMGSDHLSPWNERQGNSGHGLSWLAAASVQSALPGGMVVAPGPRQHPVVLAQALATISDFATRAPWFAVGTGERFNEAMLGEAWPDKRARRARVVEAVDIMRRLWRGETIVSGEHWTVDHAYLWTRPEVEPRLIGTAMTPDTAAWAATWADGIITTAGPSEQLRELVGAYRDAGGRGPAYLQAQVSWASTQDEAAAQAHDQWRWTLVGPDAAQESATLAELEAAAADMTVDDVVDAIRVSSDFEQHVAWLRADAEIGFDTVYLHDVGRNQAAFLTAFGTSVLPRVG